MIFSKRKTIFLLLVLVFLFPSSLSAQSGGGTIGLLPEFVATTSPSLSITQRIFGRRIKITGLTTGLCLSLDVNSLLTTTACGSGGGGGGGTFSTSTNAAYGGVFNNYPNNTTDIVIVGATATSSTSTWFDPNAKTASIMPTGTTTIGDLYSKKDYSCINLIEGDSLSDPDTQANSWPVYMPTVDHDWAKCRIVEVATTGDTIQNILSTFSTQITPYAPSAVSDRTTLYLWAGTNDINNGANGTTTYTFFKSVAQQAKALGMRVVASPIITRAQFAASAAKEGERQTFNRLFLNDVNTGLFDYVARPDLSITNSADAACFVDSVHPTAKCGLLEAQILSNTIHYTPYIVMPTNYSTTTASTLLLNPGGNVLVGSSSQNFVPPASLTLLATSSDPLGKIFQAFDFASTSRGFINNIGQWLVGATSTPYRSNTLLTVGAVQSSATQFTNDIAVFGGQQAGTSTVGIYNSGGTGRDAGINFGGSIDPAAGNNNMFASACMWSHFDNTAFSGNTLNGGLATGNGLCTVPLWTMRGLNFGIGTTTPSAALNVNTTLTNSSPAFKISNTSTGPVFNGLTIDSDYASNAAARNWFAGSNSIVYGDFNIQTSNAKSGSPVTAGTSRIYIDPSGFIGIGSTTPDYKLDVVGTAKVENPTNPLFDLFETTSGQRRRLRLQYDTTNNLSVVNSTTGVAQAPGLSLQIAGTEAIRIWGPLNGSSVTSGNVGIGTTTPHEKLTVNGNGYFGGFLTATSTTQASTFPYASTTAISAATICLTGDTCRTTWPTGAGTNFFTQTGNLLQNNTGTSLGINTAPNLAAIEAAATTSDATSNGLAIWKASGVPILTARADGLVSILGTASSSIVIASDPTATSTIFGTLAMGDVTGLASNSQFVMKNTQNKTFNFNIVSNGGTSLLNLVDSSRVLTMPTNGSFTTGSITTVQGNNAQSTNNANSAALSIIANSSQNVTIWSATRQTFGTLNYMDRLGATIWGGMASSSLYARTALTATSSSLSSLASTTVAIIGVAGQTGNLLDLYPQGVFSSVFGPTGNFGIGSTSPSATTTIQSNSSVGDAFSVATTTGTYVWGVDNDGHHFTSGPAPTISLCGTGSPSISGDDQGGIVTTGTAATSCTLTFAKAYRATPYCTASDDSGTVTPSVTTTASTVVFGLGAGLSGGKVQYMCSYHR